MGLLPLELICGVRHVLLDCALIAVRQVSFGKGDLVVEFILRSCRCYRYQTI